MYHRVGIIKDMIKTIFELNIALIPEQALASKHIALSQELAAKYLAVVQLNDVEPRLALAPHLTLYQMPVPYANLEQLLKELSAVAANLDAPDLRASKYAYNADEASFEVQYEMSDAILAWQERIINCANPLRHGLLLERDPAGYDVQSLLQDKGMLGENIRRTGYDEVGDPASGGLFRPHVTLNWFKLGTAVDEASGLPALATLNGQFGKLGVYLLGPHGTCPQRLVQYPCHRAL